MSKKEQSRAGTAAKAKVKSHNELVTDLHIASRSMLRSIGSVHMERCGDGWMKCGCELAEKIRELSETQFAFSEHLRKIGQRQR